MTSSLSENALPAFHIAIGFHEGANRCGEARKYGSGSEFNMSVPPVIVCAAFAAEMYMKALMYRVNNTKRSHDLSQSLLKRMAADDVNVVAAFYSEMRHADKNQMISDISKFTKAFEDWRYVHEKDAGQIDLDNLFAFVISLYKTCGTVEKSWTNADLDNRLTKAPVSGTILYDKLSLIWKPKF